VYVRLAEHLERLPGGFGAREDGSHLRLLAYLFTPEEAALAVHLMLEREAAATIAARAGQPVEVVAPRLEEMALKGLIYGGPDAQGATAYQALPWVVGIYEAQVNRMTPAFLEAVGAYWSTADAPRRPVRTIPQMRVIPIGESLEPHLEALPYEQVLALVDAHDRFAVAPCICRRHARLVAETCDAPEESCLQFGDFADYYVRGGRARAITREEVLALLAQADAHNLVLQPTNSQSIAAICCCCGCCCGILGNLKRLRRPARHVASAFQAELDGEACVHCGRCLERCQMDALTDAGDRVALDVERCIGCGLCVSTCPSGALSLKRKSDTKSEPLPATMEETWKIIAADQARQRG
jgi:ferredoxin